MTTRLEAIAAAKLELLIDSIVLGAAIQETDIEEARRELRPMLRALVTRCRELREAREMPADFPRPMGVEGEETK